MNDVYRLRDRLLWASLSLTAIVFLLAVWCQGLLSGARTSLDVRANEAASTLAGISTAGAQVLTCCYSLTERWSYARSRFT